MDSGRRPSPRQKRLRAHVADLILSRSCLSLRSIYYILSLSRIHTDGFELCVSSASRSRRKYRSFVSALSLANNGCPPVAVCSVVQTKFCVQTVPARRQVGVLLLRGPTLPRIDVKTGRGGRPPLPAKQARYRLLFDLRRPHLVTSF